MNNDTDEITFIVEHSDDMTVFFISVMSHTPLSKSEFTAYLRDLADDLDSKENDYFKTSNPINNQLQ